MTVALKDVFLKSATRFFSVTFLVWCVNVAILPSRQV